MAGTPLSAVVSAEGLPELVLIDLMAQLCDVLVYLEGLQLVHRNLKPENVLCELAEDGGVRVLLSDFGVAATAAVRPAVSDPTAPARCGSPGYIAPELFQEPLGASQSALNCTKIDVFSFGLLISTMLTGKNPFHGKTLTETYRNNAELKYDPGIYFGEWNLVSAAIRSLLCSVCAPDPSKRYSASEAASHPWFFGQRTRVTHADLLRMGMSASSSSIRTVRFDPFANI
jgi:serine/threonine protein kinase